MKYRIQIQQVFGSNWATMEEATAHAEWLQCDDLKPRTRAQAFEALEAQANKTKTGAPHRLVAIHTDGTVEVIETITRGTAFFANNDKQEVQSMKPVTTRLTSYSYDIRLPAENAEYMALCEELKAKGLKCFESHGGKLHATIAREIGDRELTLDLSHLFDADAAQWNTQPIEGVSANGYRIHEWAQDSRYALNDNPNRKQGYYMAISPAMRELQRNTAACGYCGKQEPSAKGLEFCDKCIGSQYLEASELYLLRMLPLSSRAKRQPLTEAESARILPVWKQAKVFGNSERDKARIKKQRDDLNNRYVRDLKNLDTEFKGKGWLMDNGINLELAIYYNHTQRFGFGWSSAKVTPELADTLREALAAFPFPYDVEMADGRKLTAEEFQKESN